MVTRRPAGLLGEGAPATRRVVGSGARCRRPPTMGQSRRYSSRLEPVTGRTRALVPEQRLPGVILPDSTTALLDAAGHFLALYRQEGPDAVADAVFV
jgi:hypothetical protein